MCLGVLAVCDRRTGDTAQAVYATSADALRAVRATLDGDQAHTEGGLRIVPPQAGGRMRYSATRAPGRRIMGDHDLRVRLPDGRVTGVFGWRTEREPHPTLRNRTMLFVSRPADNEPVRYRIVRTGDTDAVFQTPAAHRLATRICGGRLDDVVRVRPADGGRPRTRTTLRLERTDRPPVAPPADVRFRRRPGLDG